MAELKASAGLPNMITGLFKDRQSAERAYQLLIERGYEKSDISVIMSDATRQHIIAESSGDTALGQDALEGAEHKEGARSKLGGPVGGTLGTLAPIVAATGAALLIPGFIIAGPVAIALAAAGAVGLAGGLVGALTNWGVPNKRVEEYESAIRKGGILIGVKPRSDDDADYILREWKASGGEHVHS